MNYLAESFALLAMLLNFVGYRQTTINKYRLISGFAMIALGTHFLLLDALAAAVGCYLAFFRNIIAMRTQHVNVVVVFVALNLGFLFYELFVLQHGLLVLLAYTASIIFTVGTFLLDSAEKVRKYFLVAEFLNLIYAVNVGSIIGTLGIVINMAGILSKFVQERRAETAS